MDVLIEFLKTSPLRMFNTTSLVDENQDGELEAMLSIPIASTVLRPCLGDCNGSGEVGETDLFMLFSAWSADCVADPDGSGSVDGVDRDLLFSVRIRAALRSSPAVRMRRRRGSDHAEGAAEHRAERPGLLPRGLCVRRTPRIPEVVLRYRAGRAVPLLSPFGRM